MSVNGRLQMSTVAALDRTLKENRELRRLMSETDRTPVTFRHCQCCGLPVCGCGIEDYTE